MSKPETDEGHPIGSQDSITGLAKCLQEAELPDLTVADCERIVEQAAGQGLTTIDDWPHGPPHGYTHVYTHLPPPADGETRQLSPAVVETLTNPTP